MITNIKRKTQLFLTAIGIIFLGVMSLTSCDESEVPAGNIQLDKHGAVDMTIKTSHYDSFDVLIIDRMVYDEKGRSHGTKRFTDTMPRLSNVTDTMDTGRTFEDGNGDIHEIDTLVRHAKNYQIYISVK